MALLMAYRLVPALAARFARPVRLAPAGTVVPPPLCRGLVPGAHHPTASCHDLRGASSAALPAADDASSAVLPAADDTGSAVPLASDDGSSAETPAADDGQSGDGPAAATAHLELGYCGLGPIAPPPALAAAIERMLLACKRV